jgi:hypothetical protein
MNLSKQEIEDLEDALFYASVKAAILIFARRIIASGVLVANSGTSFNSGCPVAHARRSPAGAFDALDAQSPPPCGLERQARSVLSNGCLAQLGGRAFLVPGGSSFSI